MCMEYSAREEPETIGDVPAPPPAPARVCVRASAEWLCAVSSVLPSRAALGLLPRALVWRAAPVPASLG